jgi:flagellar hook-basal body complex protein FliE
MIDPVSAQAALNGSLRLAPGADGVEISPLRQGLRANAGDTALGAGKDSTFGNLVGGLVGEVDAKSKTAEAEVRKLMLGESDNIHRSMIAMQEAGVAFTLLLEVRNKLVESYQELMRMPV